MRTAPRSVFSALVLVNQVLQSTATARTDVALIRQAAHAPDTEHTILRVACRPISDCLIVRLDGIPVEPSRELRVTPGLHAIQVEADKYRPASLKIEVPSGELHLIDVSLDLLPALVTVTSTPPGAEIAINGVIRGVSPLTIEIVPGEVVVEFRPPTREYGSANVARVLGAAEVTTIEAMLPMLAGRVRVTTNRPWKQLQIDGRLFSLGPDAWRTLPSGRHALRAWDGIRHIAESPFNVPKGGDVVVALKWLTAAPPADRYVRFPRAVVELGSRAYSDANPPRTITTQTFWLARKEVTVAEYRLCVIAKACTKPATGEACNWDRTDRQLHSVNCVSAEQAEMYAAWVSLDDGLAYRLPTADEWEQAADMPQAATDPTNNRAACNICDRRCPWRWRDESRDDSWETTAPPGSMQACVTSRGLMDLAGNVAEWCRGILVAGTYQLRGGSWASPAAFLDPKYPNPKPRNHHDAGTGFRLAASERAAVPF